MRGLKFVSAILLAISASADVAMARPPTPPGWVLEAADREAVLGPALSLHVTPAGTEVVAFVGSMASTVWLRREAGSWALVRSVPGVVTAVLPDGETPWFLSARDDTLFLHHGKTVDKIAGDFEETSDKASIVLDAKGQPVVCIATEQANTSNGRAAGTLRVATKTGKTWKLAKLPAATFSCSMVTTSDGRIVIGTETGVMVRRGTTWAAGTLGGPTKVLPGPIAVSERGTSIEVAREVGGAWERTPLVADIGGPTLAGFGAAVDAKGRVHVAFDVRARNGAAEVRYASEDQPKPSLIAALDATSDPVLVIDAQGPVVAFAPHFAQKHNQTVFVGHPRRAGDPNSDVVHDTGAMVGACSALVADELRGTLRLGGRHSTERKRQLRLCEQLKATNAVTLVALEQRCTKGELAACLIAGAATDPRNALMALEYATDACAKRVRCGSSHREEGRLGSYLARTPDQARAERMFTRACELGSAEACVHLAWVGGRVFAPLAKACSPAFPLACAAAAEAHDPKDRDQVAALAPVRAALVDACKTADTPGACNTLAYLEDQGTGGPKRPADALRHHKRACELGSPTSCAQLVIGPSGLQPPPRTLDADTLEALLAGRCGPGAEKACLAYATALDKGWGMPKDKPRAKEILAKACNEYEITAACAKPGKR